MENIYEYDLKLTTGDRNLLILALAERRRQKISNYPCFSHPSCDDECSVFSNGTKCPQHSIWISEIKRINDLINKIGDLKGEKVNASNT